MHLFAQITYVVVTCNVVGIEYNSEVDLQVYQSLLRGSENVIFTSLTPCYEHRFFYNNMLINHVQSSSKFCPKTLFMTAYYFLGPKHAQ